MKKTYKLAKGSGTNTGTLSNQNVLRHSPFSTYAYLAFQQRNLIIMTLNGMKLEPTDRLGDTQINTDL